MENTPLGQAYDNAKNAVVYRDAGSLNAAKESHEAAATNYDTAAHSTEDFEAVRLLTLLKEHHKDLAKALVVTKSIKPTKAPLSTQGLDILPEDTKSESRKSVENKEEANPHSSKTNPALSTLSVRRQPRRDLASSIAGNLATARGKPVPSRRPDPLPPNVTAQHAGGKLVSRGTERSQNIQRTARQSLVPAPILEAPPPENDAFSRFYNSLHGLYSKLPGSLAFTGLPVSIAEESDEQSTTKLLQSEKSKPNRATSEPEYSAIFSPSTIRAVTKETGGALGSHESFYVVPTSGGTRSYAGIVSGRGDDPNDLLADDDGEEFVDARETVGPPSPKASRTSQTLRKNKKVAQVLSSTGKTMEELELENSEFRQLVDQQSRRLQMWEASAQSQSMALAQSMRFNRKATAPENVAPQSESEQVKKLEEGLTAERTQREAMEHQYEKMERENEKLLLQITNLRKYKERWERLKESARQKQRDKDSRIGDGVDAIRLG